MYKLRRFKMKMGRKEKFSNSSKNKEKFEKIKTIVNISSKYTKIKYKNQIISLGENLIVQESDETIIGKLIEIIPTGGIQKYFYWPSIKIQIFYSKYDIDRSKNGLNEDEKFNSLSEFELFKSNRTKIFFIESISSKCSITSLEEYEKLDNLSNTTFFSRANYDTDKQNLDPSFEAWNKSCVCQNPLNPDQLYIKCDSCEKWFHPEHCGLRESEAEQLEKFFCPLCIV